MMIKSLPAPTDEPVTIVFGSKSIRPPLPNKIPSTVTVWPSLVCFCPERDFTTKRLNACSILVHSVASSFVMQLFRVAEVCVSQRLEITKKVRCRPTLAASLESNEAAIVTR